MENIEPLNPVFLKLGPLSIQWYGLIIGLGTLLALYLAIKESNRRGMHKDTFMDLVLFAVPIAIICARIYYVIFKWDYYSQNPGEIIAIWHGGIAIHGALIGSVATAIVFAKVKGLSFWKIADIAAPSIILGQAIGRWGNFMNQEAHGGPIAENSIQTFYNILPDFIMDQMYIEGTYYHPTFLYESLWSIVGFVILLLLRKVNLRRGEMFLSYVIWYSIGRAFVEMLRTDSLMLGDFRVAVLLSIALIVGSIALIIFRRAKGYSKERYLDN
ncbi:prolipoprotein diacylglyceryl transferase [Fredinandcohnia quinoae]|uniref:Phosphatidylglycerol--prolipoprotein diacylglyceryl transferase n=1 Tax=Fredinandcohnia quinoae TaxID=2918902 RepID=A0AAW5E0F3_9BACI|nr:prolipoprotein diacylglyceryl transferase [Fredinandcohnia sp. SECRCQ15]